MSTLTIRLPDGVQAKLERLAGHMRRPQSILAEQALSDYVERELAIIEAIERGRAEIRAGLFATNDEVFDGLDAEIEAARIGR